MKGSNRCPECGGIANHLITDVLGDRIFHCNNGITTLRTDREEAIIPSGIVPCDTIIDERGRKVNGTIAYITEGKVKTLSFTDGKERR